MNTITLTSETAQVAKYAVLLARTKSTAFDGMTDEEVLSALVEKGLNCEREAEA